MAVPIINPWQGSYDVQEQTSRTLANLGNTMRQVRLDSQDEEIRQRRLADLNAQQGAKQQFYGADDLQSTYLKEMQAKQAAEQANAEAEHMKRVTTNLDHFKKVGMDPKFYTEYAKKEMEQSPKFKDLAQYVTYVDNEKIEMEKVVGENEIPDPMKPGAFFPPGNYKLKLSRTGDPAKPFAFSHIEPVKAEKDKPLSNTVKDTQSPTGWSYLTEQGNMMTGAPDPTKAKERTIIAGTGGTSSKGGQKYRPMPSSTEKRLTSSAELADAMDRYTTGFKDEYAGKTIMGDASNTIQKLAGDDTGQAQFWQDYQGYVNDVRQEKFGASLTNNEKNEFLKFIVTPRMNPEQVRQNLARQKAITDAALARVQRGYATQYDPQTIEEFTGRPIAGAEATKAPAIGYGKNASKPQQKQPQKSGRFTIEEVK